MPGIHTEGDRSHPHPPLTRKRMRGPSRLRTHFFHDQEVPSFKPSQRPTRASGTHHPLWPRVTFSSQESHRFVVSLRSFAKYRIRRADQEVHRTHRERKNSWKHRRPLPVSASFPRPSRRKFAFACSFASRAAPWAFSISSIFSNWPHRPSPNTSTCWKTPGSPYPFGKGVTAFIGGPMRIAMKPPALCWPG